MKRSSSSHKRGFTLIEVLLVLVILVVLASMAVMAYTPIRKQALVNAAKAQVGLLKTSIEKYAMDIGTPPGTNDGLSALREPPAGLSDPTKWVGPYIEPSVPVDPWGKAYQYACPGAHNHSEFDVWTVSPDGQEIGSWGDDSKK